MEIAGLLALIYLLVSLLKALKNLNAAFDSQVEWMGEVKTSRFYNSVMFFYFFLVEVFTFGPIRSVFTPRLRI